MVDILKFYVMGVSKDFMLSLFVMVVSFSMVFWEHKTDFYYYCLLQKGTDVVVNSIAEDVWDSKYEVTGALIDKVESWD